MTQIQALQAELSKISAQIAIAQKQERKKAIATIRKAMQEHGIKLSTLTGAPPKYRNPATGATWAGRGKEPLWIKGKDRAAFAV